MVANKQRLATIRALTDTVLLSLDYERFRAFLLRFPEALFVLFETAVERLIEIQKEHSS